MPAAVSRSARARARARRSVEVGGEHLLHRGQRSAQRRLERGERGLVDPQRPVERVPAQPLDEFGPAEDEPGLRPAEQLVAAGQHEVRARGEGALQVRLVGQQRVRAEQPGSDVGDERDAGPGQGRGQLAHLDGPGEPADDEVRRVHLEHRAGVRAEGAAVVGEGDAVRRPDLAEPGAGGGEEIGDAEAVADLDQLAAGQDQLAALPERGGDEGEGGRAVVDHDRRLGGRHGGEQRRDRRRPRGGPGGRWPDPARRPWCRWPRRPPRRRAGDSGARPRLVCTSTPVALRTGRRLLAVAGSAARTASTASGGATSPARMRCWTCWTASLTRPRPSRAPAAREPVVGQQGVGAGHLAPRILAHRDGA